jgi:nucleoid-associated protein YgaU
MERVIADANGNFGATLFIEPSDQPRVMRLIADPDGEAVQSAETYFVQPTLTVAAVTAVEADEVTTEAPRVDEVAETVEVTTTADVAAEEIEEDTATPAAEEIAEVVAQVEIAEAVETAEAVESAITEPTEPVTETAEQDVEPEVAEALTVLSVETVDVAEPELVASLDIAVEAPAPPAEPLVIAETSPVTPETVVTEAPVELASPAVLVADAEGVRVLQPAISDRSPEVMSSVALDTITYDNSGEVLIAGRALGVGSVQVYLNNRPITTTLIDEQGNWRTDLPDVDTGIYTLRIDEVAADGDVVSRIETPFQREEAETVAAVFADEVADESFEVAVRTVQPGATLWAIAREQFGSGIMYVAVFEANKDRIRDPDLIYPGQVFRIPEATE